MGLRVIIRNWLLKPSKAELAGDAASVQRAGELIWGHLRRDMARTGSMAEAVHVEELEPGELK